MKINQLKSGIILSYATTIIGSVISIAYTPVMLRLLGQSEYGLYTLAGSVVAYLNLLNFGFSSSYVRYFSRYKVNDDQERIAKLNGMFMLIFLVLGVIAFAAGLIISASSGIIFSNKLTFEEIKITRILIAILSFNVALTFPFTVYNSYITANEKFFFHKLLSLIKAVCNPILTLIILLLGFRSIGMVVITVVVNVGIDIVCWVYSVKKLNIRFNFKGFDKALFKDISAFSSFIFINIVVDQINLNVGKLLLGVYHGSIATAIYGLAAQLNTYYQQISTTISSVFIPRIHKLVSAGNKKEVNLLFNKVGRIQFIILMLVCTGFLFFGKPFILFWGGSEYTGSYIIALLMFFPLVIPLIQNLGIEIQRAYYLHKFRAYVYIGMAALNILISIPLCKFYSGVGCTIGTAISLIVGNGIIMNIYYHKKCSMDVIGFWKEILKLLPSFIPPIAVGIVINILIDTSNFMGFVMGIMIYFLVYIISIWFIGLNDYEKSLFKKPLSRIFGRK